MSKKELFCNIISVINHIHTYVGMFLHSILFHWSLFLSLYKYITVLKITLKTQSLTPSGVYKSSYLFSPLSTWFWRLCMCMCFWAVFLFYWSIFLIPYQTLTYWYFIIHPDVYRLKPLTLFIFFLNWDNQKSFSPLFLLLVLNYVNWLLNVWMHFWNNLVIVCVLFM